ncbi:hypothetical protein CAEBREN_04535 [Caenorhabditis brenneri]|uniref:Uncharacterized protein n=1 Tax=Caenorhabditis brenneri TaxID=135651 RepID=G0P2Z2_CAEBE|nr:hypothetical protein CAEBREN_04535 [Caenorhabditis brenneri]
MNEKQRSRTSSSSSSDSWGSESGWRPHKVDKKEAKTGGAEADKAGTEVDTDFTYYKIIRFSCLDGGPCFQQRNPDVHALQLKAKPPVLGPIPRGVNMSDEDEEIHSRGRTKEEESEAQHLESRYQLRHSFLMEITSLMTRKSLATSPLA